MVIAKVVPVVNSTTFQTELLNAISDIIFITIALRRDKIFLCKKKLLKFMETMVKYHRLDTGSVDFWSCYGGAT